jgi:NSS family neurotransmitter:Na+ symporter
MTYGVLALCLCTFCFGLTIPYTDSRGVFLIDIVDHFLINYGIVLIAFVEIILAAWITGNKLHQRFYQCAFKEQDQKLVLSTWTLCLARSALVIIISNVVIDIRNPYRNYPVEAIFKYGVLPATLIVLGAIVLGIIGRKTSSA